MDSKLSDQIYLHVERNRYSLNVPNNLRLIYIIRNKNGVIIRLEKRKINDKNTHLEIRTNEWKEKRKNFIKKKEKSVKKIKKVILIYKILRENNKVNENLIINRNKKKLKQKMTICYISFL